MQTVPEIWQAHRGEPRSPHPSVRILSGILNGTMESHQLMPELSQQDARQRHARVIDGRREARTLSRKGEGYTLDEITYNDGYPTQVGWYDVLIDGGEDRLLHRYCHMENRHKWQDIDGHEIKGKVMWTGQATQTP